MVALKILMNFSKVIKKNVFEIFIKSSLPAGADLGISRGGVADFQKKFEKFIYFFLGSTKLIL